VSIRILNTNNVFLNGLEVAISEVSGQVDTHVKLESRVNEGATGASSSYIYKAEVQFSKVVLDFWTDDYYNDRSSLDGQRVHEGNICRALRHQLSVFANSPHDFRIGGHEFRSVRLVRKSEMYYDACTRRKCQRISFECDYIVEEEIEEKSGPLLSPVQEYLAL